MTLQELAQGWAPCWPPYRVLIRRACKSESWKLCTWNNPQHSREDSPPCPVSSGGELGSHSAHLLSISPLAFSLFPTSQKDSISLKNTNSNESGGVGRGIKDPRQQACQWGGGLGDQVETGLQAAPAHSGNNS